MHNAYLKILELEPGVTEREIKAAYRRLSKKYHPDINKDPDAREQFIRINEAYLFLTKSGPSPNNEKVRYDFDPYQEAYKKWRENARASARQRAREAAALQQEWFKRILRVYHYIALFILSFNVMLIIDYNMPLVQTSQKIRSINGYDGAGGEIQPNQNGEIVLEDYRLTIHDSRLDNTDPGTEAVVTTSGLLDKPVALTVIYDEQPVTFHPVYSVYTGFFYLIPFNLVLLLVYRFAMRTRSSKLSLALFTLVFFGMQLYVFYGF